MEGAAEIFDLIRFPSAASLRNSDLVSKIWYTAGMKLFGKVSVSSKIIILSAVLAAIFLGTSFGYAVINFHRELVSTTQQLLEHEVLDEVEKIEISSNGARNTILALVGTPPIQGIIRARKHDGYDERETSTLLQWENRLASIFIAQMNASPLYAQLRYIDENGNELVRVNTVDGIPQRVLQQDLQNKANREYFLEAMKTQQGEIYSSSAELNREGVPPTLSVPYTPVIRFAVPVFDGDTGERRGIVITNVLVNQLVSINMPMSIEFSKSYVVNSDGYYIQHPDLSKEWGGPKDLNSGEKFATEFPGVNLSMSDPGGGSFVSDGSLFVFAKASLDTGEQWTVIRQVSLAAAFSRIDWIAATSSLIGLVAYVLLLLVFIFVIRRLLFPLKKLTEAAGNVGRGNFDQHIDIQSDDEVGQLTSVFNAMSSQLKTLYGNLELKVRERTVDLEDEKNRTQTILASIGDGLVVVDATGKIILVNQSFTDILDWQASEVFGRDMAQMIPILDQEGHQLSLAERPLGNVLNSGRKVFISDKYYLKKNKEKVPIEITIAPVYVHGKISGAIEVFRDITKEKEVDKAKTEFVSLASHQLRTPLSTINWYVEMLLAEDAGKLSKEQREYVAEVYRGNRRMVELVNALLNVSRLELGTFIINPQSTNVRELAETVFDELKPMIKERYLHFSPVFERGLPNIQADPTLLRIVIQNLLTNAVKYTNEKGKVGFEISVDKGKDEMRMVVTDSGIGIPKHQQKNIFTKLFRADNARESDSDGTGLGLYIVKSIIEHSGGNVWFESEEGKGTTFFVTLPMSGMKKKEGTRSLGEMRKSKSKDAR